MCRLDHIFSLDLLFLCSNKSQTAEQNTKDNYNASGGLV